MTDPRIKALAQQAAKKIKQVTEGKDREIAEIYKDFHAKADAIRASSNEHSFEQ